MMFKGLIGITFLRGISLALVGIFSVPFVRHFVEKEGDASGYQRPYAYVPEGSRGVLIDRKSGRLIEWLPPGFRMISDDQVFRVQPTERQSYVVTHCFTNDLGRRFRLTAMVEWQVNPLHVDRVLLANQPSFDSQWCRRTVKQGIKEALRSSFPRKQLLPAYTAEFEFYLKARLHSRFAGSFVQLHDFYLAVEELD